MKRVGAFLAAALMLIGVALALAGLLLVAIAEPVRDPWLEDE